MSLDADPLTRAWGCSRPPRGLDRAERVKMIGEVAEALLAGRQPDPAAVLFVAGAIAQWLESGGSLERDFLKVVKPKSHRTPARIWGAHLDERRRAHDGASCKLDPIQE